MPRQHSKQARPVKLKTLNPPPVFKPAEPYGAVYAGAKSTLRASFCQSGHYFTGDGTYVGSDPQAKNVAKSLRAAPHGRSIQPSVVPISLPPGDPPRFGQDIELGAAIAEYFEKHPLRRRPLGDRVMSCIGEIAEEALDAIAAGREPEELCLAEAAMYLARDGHLAEAACVWNALHRLDQKIRLLKARHGRQDQRYRMERSRSDRKEADLERVRPMLERLLRSNPTLPNIECARRIARELEKALKAVQPSNFSRVPSVHTLRNWIAELRPQVSKD